MFEVSTLISTLGFPVGVVCYLLWERRTLMKEVREERKEAMIHLDALVHAMYNLKTEIIKLNERCNGGRKKD